MKRVAGLLLIFFACNPVTVPIDEIDISADSETIPVDIIIEGAIYSLSINQWVKISRPGEWPNSDSDLPVSGAEVKVFDGYNEFLYQEDPISPGNYYSVDSLKGIENREYRLEVNWNGKSYTASDVMVPCNCQDVEPPIRSYYQDLFSSSVVLEMYSHNFGYSRPIKIVDISGDYSNLSVDVMHTFMNKTMLHTRSPFHALFPESKTINILVGNKGGVIPIAFVAYSDLYYEFILQYFTATEWSAGLFSILPGNLSTNISEGGAGFFYTGNVVIKEIDVDEVIDQLEK